LTPAIKTSRKWLELILFSKFKCEVLYVCLLTTERTPTLNIEWGQINPKAAGGLNIESGQIDPKETQGLSELKNEYLQLARHFMADATQYGMSSGEGGDAWDATKPPVLLLAVTRGRLTGFVLQHDDARLVHAEHVVNDVLAVDERDVQNAVQGPQAEHPLEAETEWASSIRSRPGVPLQ